MLRWSLHTRMRVFLLGAALLIIVQLILSSLFACEETGRIPMDIPDSPSSILSEEEVPRTSEARANGSDQPYVSFIVAVRDASYAVSGPSPFDRLVWLLRSLCLMVSHFGVKLEVVIIDWDPPRDKHLHVHLAAMRNRWLCDVAPLFKVRVITVDGVALKSTKTRVATDVQEYIGKNVGARRARGEYLWFGSTDNVLTPMLGRWLSAFPLRSDSYYTMPRYQCRAKNFHTLEWETAVQTCLARCQRDNRQCANEKRGVHRGCRLRGIPPDRPSALSSIQLAKVAPVPLYDGVGKVYFDDNGDGANPRQKLKLDNTRTEPNGWSAGDFLIIKREMFEFARGFMETPEQREHVDSAMLMTLSSIGIREVFLGPPQFILFHQPHDRKSAAQDSEDPRPKSQDVDYRRLWEIIEDLWKKFGMSPLQTRMNWGLQDYQLNETIV